MKAMCCSQLFSLQFRQTYLPSTPTHSPTILHSSSFPPPPHENCLLLKENHKVPVTWPQIQYLPHTSKSANHKSSFCSAVVFFTHEVQLHCKCNNHCKNEASACWKTSVSDERCFRTNRASTVRQIQCDPGSPLSSFNEAKSTKLSDQTKSQKWAGGRYTALTPRAAKRGPHSNSHYNTKTSTSQHIPLAEGVCLKWNKWCS